MQHELFQHPLILKNKWHTKIIPYLSHNKIHLEFHSENNSLICDQGDIIITNYMYDKDELQRLLNFFLFKVDDNGYYMCETPFYIDPDYNILHQISQHLLSHM
tara:strand:- start:354 stop:662 length:309 start_codon:yes stop_codon:yes gene_type:complete